MKRTYTLRPSPTISLFTACIGFAMLVVGLVMMSRSPVWWFLFLWIPICLFIIGYHLLNAFSQKGVPAEMIESESALEHSPPVRSIAERLKDLDDLHNRKLITDSEYATKRQEVLRDV